MALYTHDNRTLRDKYLTTFATLWTEMQQYRPLWRDLAELVKPNRMRASISDKNRGDRRNNRIISSTAAFSLRTLQAGMHSGLTSPSRPWFGLSVADPGLRQFKPVKQWLHDVTGIMHAAMLKSNIYTTYPTLYGDQGLFGTAAMGILEDSRDVFRCYPYPIGTYALGLSKRQQVDTFVREYPMTVAQLIDEFGEEDRHGQPDWSRFSTTVKNLYDRGQYHESIEVCWIVTPNMFADGGKLGAKYKRWHSVHFEKGGENVHDKVLRESGFDDFPVVAPRWEAAAEEIWGSDCPGFICHPDNISLQVMMKRKAQAVEKGLNPPTQAPMHLKAIGVNILPAGVNFTDATQANQGIRSIYEHRLDIDHLRVDIQDIQYMIRTAWYEPLFLMLAAADAQGSNPQKTATEIAERKEEKLLALGPVIERNNDELHEPAIDRIYNLLDRRGHIPPPPPDLEGVELTVDYLSIMAQAQKLVGVAGPRNFLRDALPIVTQFPEGRFKLRPFKILDSLADGYGVPPEWLAEDAEAQQLLEQAQQQAAQQQQAEQAALAARAGKDLGTTPMDGNTALARILQGV